MIVIDVTFVKIGGSVITDIYKPNSAKIDEIDRILSEIKGANGSSMIVVGHGSGSFAHVPAHKYKTNLGLINEESKKGAAITQNIAARLHRILIDRCNENGIDALSFAPSSSAMSNAGKIISWDISPMMKALELGFMPITYGDVVIDNVQGISIASTEEVFSYLAPKLRPKRIVIGTDVDGVYTSDPKIDPDPHLIERIDSKNISNVLNSSAKGSKKIDVTGGMKSKVAILYEISKNTGAECIIINSKKPNLVYMAARGENVAGTVISAK